ncbi:hypothetical protein E6C27_scaffold320G001040 [Cucumis melo var. makuwa]|uniref:Uncharacterized protein n=1 Tax=Cucumis melo var. makuwa TaxID=1194695 RepID=A0A5A7TNM3_CUCMM|nr:hypothetical protein E6C27_scaffold320G001040 [Cucumis melo var. makuwa]
MTSLADDQHATVLAWTTISVVRPSFSLRGYCKVIVSYLSCTATINIVAPPFSLNFGFGIGIFEEFDHCPVFESSNLGIYAQRWLDRSGEGAKSRGIE